MSDDLAEAEGWFAYWQTVGTQTRDHEERKAARLLQREFDRRGFVEQAATALVEHWERNGDRLISWTEEARARRNRLEVALIAAVERP